MNLLKTVFVIFAVLITNTASAAMITDQWIVSDAVENCSGGTHGLWTNTLQLGGGICKNYYGFQENSLLTEFDDGTATLVATAMNPGGIEAMINIMFSGLQDYNTFTSNGTSTDKVKGKSHGDETTWDFYTSASGDITINGVVYSLWGDGLAGDTALQIGLGANDKTMAFGASSWLNIKYYDEDEKSYEYLRHWDLNMALTAVPEPSIIALFALGLLGLGFARRRMRS